MFRWLWIASLVSNIGGWVQDVAVAWVMVDLTDSALLIALVSTAASLPIFFLSLPAGALTDVVDRRKLLLLAQGWMFLSAGALLAVSVLDLQSPWFLLGFAFSMGIGVALTNPAWQAITPELVPRSQLASAVTLGGININISRAIGPALAGILIAWAGPEAAFLCNAVSFVLILLVLYVWRPQERQVQYPERFGHALLSGLRYVRHSGEVRQVLFRTFLFILGASALWALLPIVLRQVRGFGAVEYGLLMAAIGTGALAAAGLIPRVRRLLPHDHLPRAATVVFAASIVGLAYLPSLWMVAVALFLGGFAWLCMMATKNLAAQSTSPNWVRGRVLSAYLLVFQGTLALGGFLWGFVAQVTSATIALSAAAVFLIVGLPLTFIVRLPRTTPEELEATRHWPTPQTATRRDADQPMAVTVEYSVPADNLPAFVEAMADVRRQRLRTGASAWYLLHEPAAAPLVTVLETFHVPSWAEHMRQHERGTARDRVEEERARSYHVGALPPKVTHLLAANPRAKR